MTSQSYVAHGLVLVAGRYLFLHRSAGRYLGGYWDIPGGTVELGETPGEAAVRECQEEAGLRCTLGPEVSHWENMDTSGRDINFHTITYLLHPRDEKSEVTISHEHDDYVWLDATNADGLDLVWHVRTTLEFLRQSG